MATAEDKLELAEKHLAKVQLAWDPPDWLELSLFGFYALEAAVEAAAIHCGMEVKKNHPARVAAAHKLHEDFRLPDVAGLLRDLNETRKSEAYGDVVAPDLDAEDVASEVELYVAAVTDMLGG
ncbi:MAG: hypothetical protein IH968_05610 [Gemmatimonadetes bacterium]|nr:hypothetical protein [Gemmatimonadota bacterium]